jgi:hypothetical protein
MATNQEPEMDASVVVALVHKGRWAARGCYRVIVSVS